MRNKSGNVRGMGIAKHNIRIASTFTREENEELKRIGEEQGRSVSNLVAFIVRAWLKARKA